MRHWRTVGCATATAILASHISVAQEISVRGIGNFSCGKYMELRKEPSQAQDSIFVSWIWGFLAGMGMEADRAGAESAPETEAALAYMDKYCRERPLEPVIKGAIQLFEDLGGKRRPR